MVRGLLDNPLQLLLVLLVIVLLFGAKRLPDAARGLGRSLRIFKSEVKQMQEDDRPHASDDVVPGTVAEPRPDQGTPRPGSERRPEA